MTVAMVWASLRAGITISAFMAPSPQCLSGIHMDVTMQEGMVQPTSVHLERPKLFSAVKI
jgi:hypothetical protein